MSIPNICQECPYRKLMQQLLTLWDLNLMRLTEVNQAEGVKLGKTLTAEEYQNRETGDRVNEVLKNPDLPDEAKQALQEYLETKSQKQPD